MTQRRWPGPGRQAGAGTAICALVAAVVIAASVPLEPPGIGWLLCGVAATVALVITTVTIRGAARSGAPVAPERAGGAPGPTGPNPTGGSHPDRPEAAGPPARQPSFDQLFWAAATLALLAVGTLRAAGWLFVLCLLTAGVTGCLAVTGGRSVGGMLLGLLMQPVSAVRAVPWAARGLARVRHGSGQSLGRILATTAVSIVLLVVFGALFASADAAFADLLRQLLPDIGPLTVVRVLFLFPPMLLVLWGSAFLLAAPPDLSGLEVPPSKGVRRWEWMVPLALLDLLFAAFVLVQITVLFGGASHVLKKNGPTFAQYARSGFWQLLLVTALTLAVLAAAARWAPRGTRTDRVLIRVLLGALALLTLVVVASALYRMHVYQQAYGFSRLRVLVSAFELWLGLLFTLVLVAGIRLRATWLPRLVVGSAVLALLGLAALNPDRSIADRNIDRYAAGKPIDVAYLSGLSADAVPALDRLPASLRDCALLRIADDLSDHPGSWRGWNLARSRARDLLAADPPQRPTTGCPYGRW